MGAKANLYNDTIVSSDTCRASMTAHTVLALQQLLSEHPVVAN